MIKYITLGISVAFISWIIGMMLHALIKNTNYYKTNLSNLCFIHNDRYNRIMGLNRFKWVVKNTFFKFFNPNLKLDKRVSLAELLQLRQEMTTAEISHLLAFIGVTLYAFYSWIQVSFLLAATIFLVNILLNLYPTLLQQQNKRQLDQVINRWTIRCKDDINKHAIPSNSNISSSI